tara:strand:- start:1345 stop:1533 length:189 start_codon:yes stop_codon:yes gene_type:complete
MSDSVEYDLGYYEGWRNATRTVIMERLQDNDLGSIIKILAAIRDEALEELQAHEDEGDFDED